MLHELIEKIENRELRDHFTEFFNKDCRREHYEKLLGGKFLDVVTETLDEIEASDKTPKYFNEKISHCSSAVHDADSILMWADDDDSEEFLDGLERQVLEAIVRQHCYVLSRGDWTKEKKNSFQFAF